MSWFNNVTIFSSLKSSLQSQRLGELLVNKGHLTPDGLQRALISQKSGSVHYRLGRILVQQHLITRRNLYKALVQQRAVRCLSAALAFTIFLSGAFQGARAGTIEDVPGQSGFSVTAGNVFQPLHNYPSLFGTREKASSNIAPFAKWTSMLKRYQSDLHNPKYSAVVRDWENSLRPLRGLPLAQMAQRVDDMMNAHPYIEDNVNWGVSDYWADPIEFLTRNGDCEDFAIAKYASLRMLGVPEDHLRIAIVKDMQKHEMHAILIVYTNNGDALILDNQNREVRSASTIARYQPVYSINQQGWWLHTAPGAVVLASAQ